MKVLAVDTPPCYVDALRARGTAVHACSLSDPLGPDARDATVLLYWSRERSGAGRLLRDVSWLQWMHVPWIGNDSLMFEPIASGKVALTNSPDVASIPVAEYVHAAVLAIAKGFVHFGAAQARREWMVDHPVREVFGARMLVVG